MTLREVRAVRAVPYVSVCNCLREVIAGGARAVRDVIAQVIDFVAGGNCQSAAARAPSTTYYPGGCSQPAARTTEETGNEAVVSDVRVLVGASDIEGRDDARGVLSPACAKAELSGPRSGCGLAAYRFAAVVRRVGGPRFGLSSARAGVAA